MIQVIVHTYLQVFARMISKLEGLAMYHALFQPDSTNLHLNPHVLVWA